MEWMGGEDDRRREEEQSDILTHIQQGRLTDISGETRPHSIPTYAGRNNGS